jgi:hypothetical protein
MPKLPRFVTLATSLTALALLASCSSSSSSTTPTDGGSTASAVDAFWCPSTPPASCGSKLSVCGVCVAAPTNEAQRTSGWKEYSGTGPVDTSCFDAANVKPLGTPKNVNMRGWVRIFANGPDSNNVKIEVFKEGPNGSLGDKVGEGASDGTLTTFADGAPAGTQIELITVQGQVDKVQRTLYPYEIKATTTSGIPTETPLIVKTTSSTANAGWFPLYDYNIVARNDALVGSGANVAYNYPVRALGNDDYVSILKAAYNRLPDAGQSAIAGEVHDCGDVRLQYATVGLAPTGSFPLFYLTDTEDNPLPQGSLKSTAGMGLYAVGALNPNTYTVAALGMIGGKTTSLGTYTVQTFPDSVTAISFRGLRPWQVPTK